VHRPKMYDRGTIQTEALLYHRKARFDELGYPCKLGLNYELKLGRYKSIDYDVM
jgi:twinkle protein